MKNEKKNKLSDPDEWKKKCKLNKSKFKVT